MSTLRLILYGCSFALLAVLGVRVASPPQLDRSQKATPIPSPGQFGLVIATKYLNFGEVWEDERFPWTLPIENRSSKEVRLELRSSCNCLATVPSSLTIPAGEQRDIVLTMDLRERPGEKPAPLSGLSSRHCNLRCWTAPARQ